MDVSDLSQISPSSSWSDLVKSQSWCQRCDLMAGIKFLTRFFPLDSVIDKSSKDAVLYIGDGLGKHVELLALLFPQLHFIVHDPKYTKAPPDDITNMTIFAYELGKVTDDNLDSYAIEGRKMLMIVNYRIKSRRDIMEEAGSVENYRQVVDNYRIAEILAMRRSIFRVRPYAAMMSIELPYPSKVWKENLLVVPEGVLFVPPWDRSGKWNTRCHLMFSVPEYDIVPEMIVNLREFLGKLWRINEMRSQKLISRPIEPSQKGKPSQKFHLSDNYDSVVEAQILRDYLKKYYPDKKTSVVSTSRKLTLALENELE